MNKDRQIRRSISAAAQRAAMRDGRIQRAATFKDRKREASRRACRGKAWK